MSNFKILKNGKVTTEFNELGVFLGTVDTLLQVGEKFSVVVANRMASAFDSVNELFLKHNIEIVIHANFDPKAMDYVVNALVGSVVGAATGAATGAAAWLTLKGAASVAQFAIPGVGQFLLVGAIGGAVIGAVFGTAVTRWGFGIRFDPRDPSRIKVDFEPLPAAA